jgi:hypothetical protein
MKTISLLGLYDHLIYIRFIIVDPVGKNVSSRVKRVLFCIFERNFVLSHLNNYLYHKYSLKYRAL